MALNTRYKSVSHPIYGMIPPIYNDNMFLGLLYQWQQMGESSNMLRLMCTQSHPSHELIEFYDIPNIDPRYTWMFPEIPKQ